MIEAEKFHQTNMDMLKTILLKKLEKGERAFYEIHVDKMKVTDRTEDPEEFFDYENYINGGTKNITVKLFDGKSNNCKQYIYSLIPELPAVQVQSPAPVSQELSGVAIENMLNEKLANQRKELQTERLQEKYEELMRKNNDDEQYINTLELRLETLTHQKTTLNGMDVGEVLSAALEGLLRRNTRLLAKIPGANGLAGIIEQDNAELGQAPVAETNTSFKRREADESISDEDKERIELLKDMQQRFTPQELESVYLIIGHLSANRKNIPTVVGLLTQNN